MVRFSTSLRSICGAWGCEPGWDVAESRCCGSEGVFVPVPAFDTGLEGIVWLSRVKRRDVMIT